MKNQKEIILGKTNMYILLKNQYIFYQLSLIGELINFYKISDGFSMCNQDSGNRFVRTFVTFTVSANYVFTFRNVVCTTKQKIE